MKYLSVCSGIDAASVAWGPLGWTPLAFAEIDAFPRAVLAHHYPSVPLYGDFTVLRHEAWIVDADVLVGGTPCQSFSVAGLRQSLSDDRGNLALEFIRLANAIDDLRRAAGRQPVIICWENVPGVFSTSDNAFGAFLGGLVGSDGPLVPPERWDDAGVAAGPERVAAWRCLDAQHFGLAQRRKRVFVLAQRHPRGWACADALLPIAASLSGHPAPRREAGQVAPTVPSRRTGGGGLGTDFDCDGGLIAFGGNNTAGPIDVATACNAHGGTVRSDFESETFIAHSLRADGFDASEDGTGRGTPLVPVAHAFDWQSGGDCRGLDPKETAQLQRCQVPAVAFSVQDNGRDASTEISPTMRSQHDSYVGGNLGVVQAMHVRRLTARECERLQGFPDDYTAIPYRGKPAADGPRYKALGNSMAVPVMGWIGRRIQQVENIDESRVTRRKQAGA